MIQDYLLMLSLPSLPAPLLLAAFPVALTCLPMLSAFPASSFLTTCIWLLDVWVPSPEHICLSIIYLFM